MDVSVYRLTAPLPVSGYRPYAEASRPATVPAGTYWIPLAQPQKHWIQMLLNEDTYQPTLFTYGLSGWSNPLLMNLDGGTSGDDVAPVGALVPPVGEPPAPALPDRLPRIGVYQMSNGSFAEESAGSTRWLFDTQWHLPYDDVEAGDLASGALRGLDVLVVPGGGSKPALRRLGGAGRRAIVDWVNAGGRYVGYRGGGTRLAATIGLSTVLLSRAKADIPGSLVRARVDTDSPLSDGVGPYVWVLFADDFVMRADNGSAPVRFPTAESGDFFVSGFARREENVEGTAAVVDEPVGDGRVVLFNADPTYQGSTEGMERILFNAVLGPDPAGSRGTAAGSRRRAGREAAARRAAATLPPWSGAIRLTVAREDRRLAAELLGRLGARFDEDVAGGAARFSIANPRELSLEEHPWALLLVTRLQRRGARIIAVSAG
jgi:hypothetical protein